MYKNPKSVEGDQWVTPELINNPNPDPNLTPDHGEESQSNHMGGPERNVPPEGEAFTRCVDMLKLAGKTLTTLVVKAGRVQLRVNNLKANLATQYYPPNFAPKAVPFGEATVEQQDRWRALDVDFWKRRTETAIAFEQENAEKANQDVENHLGGTTKFLLEANCTPLGLKKLAELWDSAQAEGVSLAQHQLETAGPRKRSRGETKNVHTKCITKHFPSNSRPKGGVKRPRRNLRKTRKGKGNRRAFKAPQNAQTRATTESSEETIQASPIASCTKCVSCNCPTCCIKINLAPVNLGRLIKACREGTGERKTSSKFLCNLSDFTLGEDTIRLLSKGLTFIPKPIFEKRATLRREVEDFIRKLRLKYMFRNRDQPVPELYRKTGYDPGKTGSITLERFIDELRETLFMVIKQRPSKPPKDNLGPRMRRALAALQRQKQFLVFRKADKGSVIVVENVEDYIRNGREHLADPQVYQRLDRNGQELAQAIKQAVKLRLRRLHNAGKLTEEQYKYCLPPPKVRPGRLYFLKKIHKRPHGIRPIVSSCANATENTSQFVDICLQPLAKSLPSYIRDSTDFINKIKDLRISQGAILASLDVVSLYTNIPHREGIASVHKATLESESPRVEAATLAELTKIVLKNNILEFAGENFLQIQGTAMGTKLAPAYANVFMGDVERRWQMLAPPGKIVTWYRFIDDIFLIWDGSENELNQYVADCNTTHESIKVTCVQSTTEVTFLDVTVFKGPKFHNIGCLDFKTHIKETNSRSYVHASSYHPRGTHKGIIVGEIHRYFRTNSGNRDFWKQMMAHAKALFERGYKQRPIIKLFAETLDKLKTLQTDDEQPSQNPEVETNPTYGRSGNPDPEDTVRVPRGAEPNPIPNETGNQSANSGKTPILVLTYNDKMETFNRKIKELWRNGVDKDALLKRLFPKSPLIAIRRNTNVREMISRAQTNNVPRRYTGERYNLRAHIAVPRNYLETLGRV